MTLLTALCLGILLALGLMAARSRLAGFLSQRPAQFRGKGPVLDLRRHLNGPILCEGLIYGPLGRVTSRFVARMEARWDGSSGRMTEDFHYDSGSVQHRVWTLQVSNDGRVRATAPDVLGEGSGVLEGPALRLDYRIRLPDDAGGHVLRVTDWMYLMENGTIMNRSQFRKFGIKVAELVATMRPVPA